MSLCSSFCPVGTCPRTSADCHMEPQGATYTYKKHQKNRHQPTDGVADCTIRNLFSGPRFPGISFSSLSTHQGYRFLSHQHTHNTARAIMHRGYTRELFSFDTQNTHGYLMLESHVDDETDGNDIHERARHYIIDLVIWDGQQKSALARIRRICGDSQATACQSQYLALSLGRRVRVWHAM